MTRDLVTTRYVDVSGRDLARYLVTTRYVDVAGLQSPFTAFPT